MAGPDSREAAPSQFVPASSFRVYPFLELGVHGVLACIFAKYRDVAASTVQWNGSPLATAFFNPTQLAVSVPASLIANPGKANVMAVNPGGLSSAAATFTINGLTATGLYPLPRQPGVRHSRCRSMDRSRYMEAALLLWPHESRHLLFSSRSDSLSPHPQTSAAHAPYLALKIRRIIR